MAPEGRQGGLAAGAETAGLGLEVRAIDAVAKQGMADMGEVDPDLMGASGLELAGESARPPACRRARDTIPGPPNG